MSDPAPEVDPNRGMAYLLAIAWDMGRIAQQEYEQRLMDWHSSIGDDVDLMVTEPAVEPPVNPYREGLEP